MLADVTKSEYVASRKVEEWNSYNIVRCEDKYTVDKIRTTRFAIRDMPLIIALKVFHEEL